MALSNILREPRREITESLVGCIVAIGAIRALVWADYQYSLWLNDGVEEQNRQVAMGTVFGCVVFLGGALLITEFAVATHALGEFICNALEQRGVRLRPVRRP